MLRAASFAREIAPSGKQIALVGGAWLAHLLQAFGLVPEAPAGPPECAR